MIFKFYTFISGIFFFFSIFLFNNACSNPDNDKYSLLFNSGKVVPAENLEAVIQKRTTIQAEVVEGRIYRIIQFYSIPSKTQKEELRATGMKLLDYLPNYAYIASVPAGYDFSLLTSYEVRSIIAFHSDYKLVSSLFHKNYPSWALSGSSQIELNIVGFQDLQHELILQKLQELKFIQVLETDNSQSFRVLVPLHSLGAVAALPYISYIEPVDPPAEPENLPGRTSHRSNMIATYNAGGRHYDGSGVRIAMGDDGIIGPHIDFQGRTDQSNVTLNNGNHGDHVAGTIMGAGNLNPLAKGMAFGAELFVYQVWNAVNQSRDSYLDHDIRITSTSYSNGCNAGYTNFARRADQHIREMPSLMHVFSAGNTGPNDCDYGAGEGWGNITGGVKIGKNVIAVGNVTASDHLANSSSRGPAHDGRIKPDICAVGTNVLSTIEGNQYDSFTGTSMACPGVTGIMAQLYQAYKEMNGGIDPESGLIKAILMNTADDLGNPGPDYKFGFGRINAFRAIKTLEESGYQTGQLEHGNSNKHFLAVPSGTKQVNIMVYWTDHEAVSNAGKALVNDINMKVTDPSSNTFLPWILNPTPDPLLLDQPATRGIDSLNNVEQVTLQDPVPGTYEIDLEGFMIPFGPQKYFLVYEFINDEITVTYPNGGESFVPVGLESIRWDAYGNFGDFLAEFSLDSGVTWQNISATIPGSSRMINWNPPQAVTGQALIKISRGAQQSLSAAPFSIISTPANLKVEWSCIDSLKISWDPAPGANYYEVSMLGQKYMETVDTTSNNFMIIRGTDYHKEDWLSVRAFGALGASGRRAIAVKKNSGVWTCPYDYDLQVIDIMAPTGMIPNCQDLSAINVTANIENTGKFPASGFQVAYRLENGAVIKEPFPGSLAPGEIKKFEFSQKIDFSTSGVSGLKVWTEFQNDPNPTNDTTKSIINIYTSSNYEAGFFEDFEDFWLCTTNLGCEEISCYLSNGWRQETNFVNDDLDWRTNRGSTPSSGTGPQTDHTTGNEAGKYLYLSAQGCNHKKGFLISPCISLSANESNQLEFWYHMFGAPSMGSLHIDILSGGNWTNDIIPPIEGNHGNQWNRQIVNLDGFEGEVINIRFRGQTTTARGDIAIDDVSVGISTSIEKQQQKAVVNFYPNPSGGKFRLNIHNTEHREVDVTIFDFQGRPVYSKILKSSKAVYDEEIDISPCSKGIYYMQLKVGDELIHKKISTL